MPFPILAGKAIVDTGFNVANSCRFAFGDSPKLSIGNDKGSNVTKFTFSCWFKTTTQNSSYGRIYYTSSAGGEVNFTMYAAGYLAMIFNDGSAGERSWLTTAKYRDPTAWYHAVVRYDSTDATAADRQQLWINGVRVTSFSESANVAENEAMPVFNDENFAVGREVDANDRFSFDGYLAEVCLIDGTAYTATDFGEYDEDSPATWKPKDVSGLTFGAKGFYLDFEDSSALGNDVSGNNNDLTVSNLAAIDQSTDTPTNNFCTLNAIDNYFNGATFTQGNCKVVTGNSPHGIINGTFGLSSGKWYFEMKIATAASSNWDIIGISDIPALAADDYLGEKANAWGWTGNGGEIFNNGSGAATSVTHTTNDILGCYFDLDNNKLYFAKNGTLVSSTGSSLTAAASTTNGHYFPSCGDYSGSSTATFELNFGGCSAFTVSSGNADANGYGNFEYDPSSGTFDGASKNFLAICTKNLAEEG